MILLYTEKLVDVNLNQVIPTCETYDVRIIPLVGEDVNCVRSAINGANHGVVLKSNSKLWVTFVRELKPSLTIYTWGVVVRNRNFVPIYSGRYRGFGVYYVRDRRDLEPLVGKPIYGVLLNVENFNPYLVESIVKTPCCTNCSLVEKLMCTYREVEIL